MKLLSIPLGLATSIILARILGPEGFGQYAFIMALIPLIALPVSGGLQQLLTREVAIFAHNSLWSLYKGALRASYAWVLGVSVLILGVYWLIGPGFGWVSLTEKWSLLPIAIWMIPLLGFSAVRVGAIKGLGKPALAELPQQLMQPLLMLVFVACAGWFGVLDTKVAVGSQIASAFLVFCLASYMLLRVQPKTINTSEPSYLKKTWLVALVPFSILTAVNLFNIQVGILILGIMSSDEQVAALKVAERGGQLVLLSLTLVNMIIAPHFVRAHRQNDSELLQKLAQGSARGAFFIALPIAFVMIVAGNPIISLVFGSGYSESSYIPLVIISLAQLANVFFGSVGYLLVMTGNEKDSLMGQLVALLVNVIMAVVLVPFWGAVGAAAAIMVSIVAWNVILLILVRKRLRIKCAAI